MTEIQRLASEAGENGQIEFARDDSHLFFRVDSRLLISRILTGQFPNYEAVLPRDNGKTIVLERGEFNDAVRRVSQLADQRTHAVRFSVSPEGVELSASSPEYGEATENIENDYKGEPISIGFNGQYLTRFSGGRCRRPHQRGAERRAVCRPNASAGGRTIPLSLRHHAHAHLMLPIR